MTPTMLHVEDDSALAELVQAAFEGFGFRGTTLTAETVAEADQILDDVARRRGVIDLILSDMMLPDGTGLDVVRHARRNSSWEHTPILILSGDADPDRVGRAYALGANCYVSKAPRGRSLGDVVKTLYDHWLKDAVLPKDGPSDRTHQFITRAINVRSRHAAFYLRMAEQFADSPSEVAFWMARALTESNQVNLLRFLQQQFVGHTWPAELLDEVEQAQATAERALAAVEHAVEDRPITTRDEAYRRTIELVSIMKVRSYARLLSYLFPVKPVAIAALIDALAINLLDLSLDRHPHR